MIVEENKLSKSSQEKLWKQQNSAWICRFKESATKTTLDTDDFLREFYQASTEQITSMLSLLFPNLWR